MEICSEEIGPGKREQTPTRYRKAKSSARLAGVQAAIEELMGLPAGSVRFVTPDGRTVRSDAMVRTLRAHWGE